MGSGIKIISGLSLCLLVLRGVQGLLGSASLGDDPAV